MDCCKAVAPPPPNPLQCNKNLCSLNPAICSQRQGDDSSDLSQRDVSDNEDETYTLEKRGGADMIFNLRGLRELRRRALWPSRGTLFGSAYRRQNVLPFYFRMANRRDCPDSSIQRDPLNPNGPTSSLPAELETEHAQDVSDLAYNSCTAACD